MTANNNNEMKRELERCQGAVEDRLGEYFTENAKYATLLEAMRYSILGGGKRIRAVICIKFCEAAGGTMADAIDAACAVEMLHAYSLIHDDLPCMDNDDMRRGKPSNHIKYGECTATLAGDALQAAAFEVLLASKLPADAVVQMGLTLARAAGSRGMCGGQYLDMLGEGKRLTTDELAEIHELKTAALISAAARMGVLAARGSDEQVKAANDYARAVGLAFQARDDLLDLISTEAELGKPIGSDKESEKTTIASLLGADECRRIIREETERAVAAIGGGIFKNAQFLVWFAQILEERSY